MSGALVWVSVLAGGAIGAGLRHSANLLALRQAGLFGAGTYSATLVVNTVGSALMGLLLGLVLSRPGLEAWRPFLATGVLGGLTTFSTLSAEAHTLFARGELGLGLVYLALSVTLGLAGFACGAGLARWAG